MAQSFSNDNIMNSYIGSFIESELLSTKLKKFLELLNSDDLKNMLTKVTELVKDTLKEFISEDRVTETVDKNGKKIKKTIKAKDITVAQLLGSMAGIQLVQTILNLVINTMFPNSNNSNNSLF